jgi:hypothetical protein
MSKNFLSSSKPKAKRQKLHFCRFVLSAFRLRLKVVENNGVEPLTFPMQDRDALAPMANFLFNISM